MSNLQDLIEDIKKEFITILGSYNNNGVKIEDHRHELFLHSLLELNHNGGPSLTPTNGPSVNFIDNLFNKYFDTNNPTNAWVDLQFKDTTGANVSADTTFSTALNYVAGSTGTVIRYELPIYLYNISSSLTMVPSHMPVSNNIKNSFIKLLYILKNIHRHLNHAIVTTYNSLQVNVEILLSCLFKTVPVGPLLPGGPLHTPLNFTFTGINPYNTIIDNYINIFTNNLENIVFNTNMYVDLCNRLQISSVPISNLITPLIPLYISTVNEVFYKLIFTTNTTKYLRRNINIDELLNMNKQKAASIIDAMQSYYDNNVTYTNNKEYYRKPENPEILYTRHRFTNKEVDVDDPHYDNERTRLSGDKCMGVDGMNPSRCADYLNKCISGSDINGCKEFMTNNAFWSDASNPGSAKNNVKNMSPKEVILTLNKLLFVHVHNELDSSIKEYESVDKWLSKIKNNSSITATEYTNIQQNVNLIHFLNLLVEKINSNPEILNPNMVINKTGTIDQFDNAKNKLAGIRSIYYPTNFANRSIDQLLYRINNLRPVNYNIPLFTNLRGGGHTISDTPSPDMLAYLKNLNIPDTPLVSFTYQKIFNDIMYVLKNYNKTISADDVNKINNLIEKMKNNEKTLLAIQLTLHSYIGSIKNDYTPDTKDFNEILELVNLNNGKSVTYLNKETTGINILNTIALVLKELNLKKNRLNY